MPFTHILSNSSSSFLLTFWPTFYSLSLSHSLALSPSIFLSLSLSLPFLSDMSVSLSDSDDVLFALARMNLLIERLHDNLALETTPTSSSCSSSLNNVMNGIHHTTSAVNHPLVNPPQANHPQANHPPTINTPAFTALLSSLLEACRLCQSVYTTLLPKAHHHNQRDLKLLTIHKRKQVGVIPNDTLCITPPLPWHTSNTPCF